LFFVIFVYNGMLALEHSLAAVERLVFRMEFSCEIALEIGTVTLPREGDSFYREGEQGSSL